MNLADIRARCSQSVTDIVDNPREYFRVQQILRDRRDLLAEVERLRAFVERVATYTDYTHDDVDEMKILHDLQHAAAQLVGDVSAQGGSRE